jgi:hypothetical protein
VTKERDPQTAQGAFNRTILELPGSWKRAALELGVGASTLYAAADPEPEPERYVPIRLEWVERLDLLRSKEGGDSLNRLAWQARHEAALAGLELPQITPEDRLQRAAAELKAALTDYERRRGDPQLLPAHLAAIQSLCATLLKVWAERMAEGG